MTLTRDDRTPAPRAPHPPEPTGPGAAGPGAAGPVVPAGPPMVVGLLAARQATGRVLPSPPVPRPRGDVDTPDPGPRSPVGSVAGAHRGRRLGARRRAVAVAATTGALTLSGILALGVDPSRPGTGDPSNGVAGRAVPGLDGLHPGGPAHRIPVTVRNEAKSSFEVTGARLDLAALPAGCPSSVWEVSAPAQPPTVAPRAEATLTVPVALADRAPAACQGLDLRFPVRVDGVRHPTPTTSPGRGAVTGSALPGTVESLTPASLDGVAHVTTGTLGSPRAVVGARGALVTVTPWAPTSGPVPAEYTVSVEGAHRPLCTAVAGECADREAPPAAERRYVVLARLGDHWTRSSPAVRAWTPPPVPDLALTGDGAGLVLRTASADGAYQVDLVADGGPAPFRVERIGAGDGTERVVPLPQLAPGAHRVTAVARFHGWRAASGALRLVVSASGASTDGPAGSPPPVTADATPSPAATGPALPGAAAPPGGPAGPAGGSSVSPGSRRAAGPAARRPARRTPLVRQRHPAPAPEPVPLDSPLPEAPEGDPHEIPVPADPAGHGPDAPEAVEPR